MNFRNSRYVPKIRVLAPNFDFTTTFSFVLNEESAGPIGPFFFPFDVFVIVDRCASSFRDEFSILKSQKISKFLVFLSPQFQFFTAHTTHERKRKRRSLIQRKIRWARSRTRGRKREKRRRRRKKRRWKIVRGLIEELLKAEKRIVQTGESTIWRIQIACWNVFIQQRFVTIYIIH